MITQGVSERGFRRGGKLGSELQNLNEMATHGYKFYMRGLAIECGSS
jgi:hypothetical protein